MPRIFRLPEDFPLPPEEIAKRIEENKALMLRLRKRRLSFKRIVLLLEHLNLPFKLAESYRNEDYYEKLMRKYGRVYKTAQAYHDDIRKLMLPFSQSQTYRMILSKFPRAHYASDGIEDIEPIDWERELKTVNRHMHILERCKWSAQLPLIGVKKSRNYGNTVLAYTMNELLLYIGGKRRVKKNESYGIIVELLGAVLGERYVFDPEYVPKLIKRTPGCKLAGIHLAIARDCPVTSREGNNFYLLNRPLEVVCAGPGGKNREIIVIEPVFRRKRT